MAQVFLGVDEIVEERERLVLAAASEEPTGALAIVGDDCCEVVDCCIGSDGDEAVMALVLPDCKVEPL